MSAPPKRDAAEDVELPQVTRTVTTPLRAADDDALPESRALGRYLLLDRLGAGGMGVVHAAYDPELDRKVAIKLVAPDTQRESRGRARLLREAQAMARLQHPNVVAVHDVGQYDDGVFIAMEYVDGITLGRWLEKGPTLPEILEAFLAAGRGLAAAHERGIVHRDFKPENVMISAGGRVRVLDFGIAHAASAVPRPDLHIEDASTLETGEHPLTAAGAIMGTPRYMAPEQHLGAAVDHRTDQFSFCVALFEATTGKLPFGGNSIVELTVSVVEGKIEGDRFQSLPRWLSAALRRGLSVPVDDRFASMDDLLAVLSQGLAGRRRRPLLAVGATALALVAGSLGYDHVAEQRAVAACTEAGDRALETLDEAALVDLDAAIRADPAAYAEEAADRVVGRFATWGKRWRDLRTQSCVAGSVDNTLDPDLAARADACFDEHLVRVETMVRGLSTKEKGVAGSSLTAAAELPIVDSCTEEHYLQIRPTLAPDDAGKGQEVRRLIAEADALRTTGQGKEAHEVAERALQLADEIDNAALRAGARRLMSLAELRQADWEGATELLSETYVEAVAAGAPEVAAAAAIDLVFLVGNRRAETEAGLTWAKSAEALVQILEPGEGRYAAKLMSAEASVYLIDGDYERAHELFSRSIALREQIWGPEHMTVAQDLSNLAIVKRHRGDLAGAIATARRALGIRTKELGTDHPHVAMSMSNLGSNLWEIHELDEAEEMLRQAHKIITRVYGADHFYNSHVLTNLALVRQDKGHPAEALDLQRRALDLKERGQGTDHPDVGVALLNIGSMELRAGNFDAADKALEQALKVLKTATEGKHSATPDVINLLGVLALRRGDLDGAQAQHERAREMLREHDRTDSPKLGMTLTFLGDLERRRGAPDRARALYDQAIATYDASTDPADARAADPRVGLARLDLAADDPAKALTLTERALDLRKKQKHGEGVAIAHFVHGMALWTTDPSKALAEVRHARQLLTKAGVYKETLSEIDTWLAAHPG